MKKTNYVKDVLVVLLGNFMVAVSVAFFVLPNNTLTGGVAGVAVISAVLGQTDITAAAEELISGSPEA